MKVNKLDFNHRVWSAFSRLIEQRYHRYIGFTPTLNVRDLNNEYIINSHGDLVIPLFAGEHFLGAIQVKQGGSLGSEEVNTIQALFHKVGSALLDASNSLNRDEEAKGNELEKHSINLVGGTHTIRHQIATHIHETLGSWSLVPWTDAGVTHWSSDDLEDLAGICLYIREISELTAKELQHLLTLSRLPTALRPHLIVGSARPLMELKETGAIPLELANGFSKVTLFVDQMPRDYLRLNEALEMLFEGDKYPQRGDQILI